jgi:hypothetical protein
MRGKEETQGLAIFGQLPSIVVVHPETFFDPSSASFFVSQEESH